MAVVAESEVAGDMKIRYILWRHAKSGILKARKLYDRYVKGGEFLLFTSTLKSQYCVGFAIHSSLKCVGRSYSILKHCNGLTSVYCL